MGWLSHSRTPVKTTETLAYRYDRLTSVTLGVTEDSGGGHRVFGLIEDGMIQSYAVSVCLRTWDPYGVLARESETVTTYRLGEYRIPFTELRKAFLALGIIEG